MLLWPYRADRNPLEFVRDTKSELMTCLKVHAGHDIARGLSHTKIESEFGFFHSPTANGKAPDGTMRTA